MAKIGITGANGELGRRTAQYVEQSSADTELVLLTRTPDALTESSRNTEIRQADFDQPGPLVEAFQGIDVLLLISTDAVGRRAQQHGNAISAAVTAGVKRIVYTSATNPHARHAAGLSALMGDHAETENALKEAGISWTVLRNGLYLDAFAPLWAQAAATGQLVTNNGAGQHAPVAREDCAAAAAAVLTTDGHESAVYDILGPQLIDDAAIAAILNKGTEHPVQVVHVSDQAYADGLNAAGLPAEIAGPIVGFGASIREGLLAAPIGDTEKLIGRAPISAEQFLAEAASRS
ncbi:MAG: NAD(P)H-binding protein [Gordonia amarae]